MALSIVTGGTAGTTDGTVVSASNKITFTALSPSYITAHVRTDTADTYTSDQAFTIPTGVEISFDSGATWKGVADSPYTYPLAIGDLNQAMRIRQTAIQTSSAASLVTSGTFSSCTALADVTSFTATDAGSGGQVNLSWSAVTNRTYYQIQGATDAGFTTNLTTLTSTETSTSYSVTGLTDGTTYYFRIKAVGTGQYKDSANWVTANATPTAVTFTDNFNDSSLDTTRFGTITNAGGTVTETTSLALADDGTTWNKIACLYLKAEVSLSTARTYRARIVNTSATEGCNQMTLYGCSGTAPTYSDFSNIDHWIIATTWRGSTASVSTYYNTGTWAGTAMTGQTNLGSMSSSNYYDYIIEVAQNAGTWQIRATIKNNSGTVLSQTSWVNCSSLRSESHYFIVIGRPYQDGAFNGSMTVQQFQVS